ncbi:MAG: FAD-dependent oxidoreductase [Myxococcota bacterium]|nr:FAD-dependent oxidoreductase [Myxococcota bacterium]
MKGDQTNISKGARAVQKQIPTDVDAIVIGAGLGGLMCALDLARNGFRVCVFEQHRVAGGYAHSFRRRGYHFDISLHYIGGLAKGEMSHTILSTLGVYDKLRLNRRDTLFTAEFPDFKIALPNNRRDIIATLSERFPEDRTGLGTLFDFLTELEADVIAPTLDPEFNVPIEHRPSTPYLNSTFEDLLRKYISNPSLIAILSQLWMFIGLPPSLSTATFSTCVFCSSFIKGAYDITGGGEALVRAMVERLRELGSECLTRTGVERIIVEDGVATGVVLENGQSVRAKVIVSNANPYETFFKLIPGDEVSKIFRYRLNQMEKSISLYSLYLGLDCLPSQIGIPQGNFIFNNTMDCETAYRRAISENIDNTDWCATNYEKIDASMCPPGTGIMSFAEVAPASDWFDLDRDAYKLKKRDAEERLIAKYSKRFPELQKHITVSEFATPRTMARYTRNPGGAVYGLAQTVAQSNSKRLRNRSPITGLYLTGSWTWSGGGYEGAMMTGIQTAGAVMSEVDAPRPAPKIRQAAPSAPEPAVDLETADPDTADPDTADPEAQSPQQDLDPNDAYYCHRIAVGVYGNDLNSRGYADASAYLRYMDRGRVEAIEAVCREAEVESWLTQYIVNVYKIDIDCATIVGVGHKLEVQTGLRKTSSHRAAFDQRIVKSSDGEIVADGVVEVLFLDQHRNLIPVPAELKTADAPKTAADQRERVPLPRDDARFPFQTKFRVYYEDTDCQGITYHVSYVRFCERALFDIVRTVWPEMTTSTWMSRYKVSVAHVSVRYLNASTLGDHLEVRTGVVDVSTHRITFGQRITSQDAGKIITDITTEVEFRDENEVPVPIPSQVLDATIAALPENGNR